MLGLLRSEPHEVFRFSADDLTDYYYTSEVSGPRSTRNAFRMTFHSSDLCHLRCYTDDLDNLDVRVCLSTLAMGDNLAVEKAQQAHTNVLRQLCGAMLQSEVLKYRCPIPRGDFIELLAAVHHIGIQKIDARIHSFNTIRDT